MSFSRVSPQLRYKNGSAGKEKRGTQWWLGLTQLSGVAGRYDSFFIKARGGPVKRTREFV